MRPPWRSAISAAMARPRPRCPRPARGALHQLGRPARAGPGPSRATSTRTRRPRRGRRSSTSPRPCSIALAIRLPVAWASRSSLPRTNARPGSTRTRARSPPPGRRHATRSAWLRDERAHVDDLRRGRACGRPRAAGVEVLQRERRPAQLEVDGRGTAAPRPVLAARCACSASDAAVSGPRSSWQARATSSRAAAGRGAARATRPGRALTATAQPGDGDVRRSFAPARRPAGSRRPRR